MKELKIWGSILIDQKVIAILKFSDHDIGRTPIVGERENLFASVSGACFSVPPEQPEELANYGFGLKVGLQAVFPYSVSCYSHRPSEALSRDSRVAVLLSNIKPYPILAGSAVLLGVDHAMCDDVDLVKYIEVGTRPEERAHVARELRHLVEVLKPATFKATLNNSTNDLPPTPPLSGDGDMRIGRLLDMILGNDRQNPDTQKIAQLASAKLKWPAQSFGLGKPVSLQLHFVHSAFIDKDIHPHQEVHECTTEDFLHTNQHWLASSFWNYFQFLKRGILSELQENNAIKASKRAAMLFGLLGDRGAQAVIVDLLNGFNRLSTVAQGDRRTQMASLIGNLREELAIACNGEEAHYAARQ